MVIPVTALVDSEARLGTTSASNFAVVKLPTAVALRPLTWVAVRLDAVSAFRLPVLRPLICVEVSAAVWATLNWPIWPALIAFSVTLDRAPTIAFDRAPIWLAERTPIAPGDSALSWTAASAPICPFDIAAMSLLESAATSATLRCATCEVESEPTVDAERAPICAPLSVPICVADRASISVDERSATCDVENAPSCVALSALTTEVDSAPTAFAPSDLICALVRPVAWVAFNEPRWLTMPASNWETLILAIVDALSAALWIEERADRLIALSAAVPRLLICAPLRAPTCEAERPATWVAESALR